MSPAEVFAWSLAFAATIVFAGIGIAAVITALVIAHDKRRRERERQTIAGIELHASLDPKTGDQLVAPCATYDRGGWAR